MCNGEHQDFLGSQFVNHEIREFLRDCATNRHVIRNRFEMRGTEWTLFDAQHCLMEDVQEPTAEPGLPTFIPSRRGVGVTFCQIQSTYSADLGVS